MGWMLALWIDGSASVTPLRRTSRVMGWVPRPTRSEGQRPHEDVAANEPIDQKIAGLRRTPEGYVRLGLGKQLSFSTRSIDGGLPQRGVCAMAFHPGQTLSRFGRFHNGVPGRIRRNQRIDGTVALILGQRHGETRRTCIFFRVGGAFRDEGDQIRHVHALGQRWPPPVAPPSGWKSEPFWNNRASSGPPCRAKANNAAARTADQGRPLP